MIDMYKDSKFLYLVLVNTAEEWKLDIHTLFTDLSQ